MSQKTQKYDLIVYIGRFQPFHLGHEGVLNTALANSNKTLVIIGSANKPRSPKNPFTTTEREQMIAKHFNNENLLFDVIQDVDYNDQKWTQNVQQVVQKVNDTHFGGKAKIAIIGHQKDESSYYLNMFPQWEMFNHDTVDTLNATDIRNLIFSGASSKYIKSVVPNTVYEFITSKEGQEIISTLKSEYDFIEKYKESWKAAPYAPIHVTVDAAVVQSGHILLIQRKAAPGKGLWALPGGFVGQKERLVDAMMRELREETKLKVPLPVLRGSIKDNQVFDAVSRSERGRTITHGFLIELIPTEHGLPLVKGGDDARQAKWWPINEVTPNMMFEDHYSIIQFLLGKI